MKYGLKVISKNTGALKHLNNHHWILLQFLSI